MQKTLYVGLDVHKETISATAAEEGRNGNIWFVGPIPNTPTDLTKLAKRLAKDGYRLEFCYEAGCCGYGIYRQLIELGHGCAVVAPSKIPRTSGERIKTDRGDSQKLAVMHRSGDLTPVWVPDKRHESMHDLIRARLDARGQLMRARQQLLAFLLRHGRIYNDGDNWTKKHQRWLAGQTFEQPAQQIVMQDYIEAVLTGNDRKAQLDKRIEEALPTWPLAPVVEAIRGLRGMDTLSAVTFMAAIGDLSRFDTPRQLMAYVGLVPSEHSSGEKTRRGGITKTGSYEARRMLVEAAWSYRYPPRVAKDKMAVVASLPKAIRDIAWKAQMRLCNRYRRMLAKGKLNTVVVTAIARELAGFIWAIGQEVSPAMP